MQAVARIVTQGLPNKPLTKGKPVHGTTWARYALETVFFIMGPNGRYGGGGAGTVT